MSDLVKRQFAAELRAEARNEFDEDNPPVVAGHAAVFDERTLIGSRRYGFVELISRGAFDDVLDNDVRYLENHEGLPFARTKSGTLELSINSRGLHQRAEFDTRNVQAMNHYFAIDRGDLDQMSFAFTILDDDVRQLPDDDPDFPGMVERTIKKVGRLYDVSGVTFPAYEGADIGVRSLTNDKELRSEIEGVLTRAGVPASTEDLPEPRSEEQEPSGSEDNQEDAMSVERARALAAAKRRQAKEIQ